MITTWTDVETLLGTGQRVQWGKLATTMFAARAAPPDWRIAERLMLRAESSLEQAESRVLIDAYLAFCQRHDQALAAFDYLSDSEVLLGEDSALVRCYVELAEALGRDDGLSAGLDWLRRHGISVEDDERRERALIRRQGREMVSSDLPDQQPALGVMRRLGQQMGLAIQGRRQSVLDLVPPDVPLAIAEVQANRAAELAKADMKRLLANALSSTTAKVALVGIDAAAVQILWLSQLDPAVLDAVRFAGAGDPHSLAQLTESTQWFADGLHEGHAPRLAGYVAEQQTKQHLLQEGHQVEMPDSPTQAGHDLLVDGQPVQIKHCEGAAAIDEHRAAYPDIPVIANAEHAERYQNDPMVWTDPQRSYADVYDGMEETLDALHDVPFLTAAPLHLVLACVRHAGRDHSWQEYGERVAKDSGASVVCTAGGAWLFSGVAGMALGPVGVAVAATLGAMIGSGLGDTLGKGWIGDDVGARNDAAGEALIDLACWTRDVAVLEKLDAAEREWSRIKRWLAEAEQRSLPLSITAFWRAVAQARVDQLNLFVDRLEQRLAGSESDQVKAGWQVLQAAGKIAHPGMRIRVAEAQRRLALLRPKALSA